MVDLGHPNVPDWRNVFLTTIHPVPLSPLFFPLHIFNVKQSTVDLQSDHEVRIGHLHTIRLSKHPSHLIRLLHQLAPCSKHQARKAT
jgi:hypothetical protein